MHSGKSCMFALMDWLLVMALAVGSQSERASGKCVDGLVLCRTFWNITIIVIHLLSLWFVDMSPHNSAISWTAFLSREASATGMIDDSFRHMGSESMDSLKKIKAHLGFESSEYCSCKDLCNVMPLPLLNSFYASSGCISCVLAHAAVFPKQGYGDD